MPGDERVHARAPRCDDETAMTCSDHPPDSRVPLAAYRVGVLPWEIARAAATLGETSTDWDREPEYLANLLTRFRQELQFLEAASSRVVLGRIEEAADAMLGQSGDSLIHEQCNREHEGAV